MVLLLHCRGQRMRIVVLPASSVGHRGRGMLLQGSKCCRAHRPQARWVLLAMIPTSTMHAHHLGLDGAARAHPCGTWLAGYWNHWPPPDHLHRPAVTPGICVFSTARTFSCAAPLVFRPLSSGCSRYRRLVAFLFPMRAVWLFAVLGVISWA